jgi:tetratricopeptide (TPR) repeat protein
MPSPYFIFFKSRNSRLRTAALAFAFGPVAALAFAQTPATQDSALLPPVAKVQPLSPKSSAYYHFSLGHLYEEMAGAYGNRSDYVNKAIDNYRLAMKEDPEAKFLVEDIAELYRNSGRIREAVEEAQSALKTNPDDLNARRVLARIYTSGIGDPQTNHIDEGMAHRAIDEYKQVTAKDPKDVDSFVMLGRLDRLVNDSLGAENSFKQALVADPDSEEAITGLAAVYGERNDPKKAAQILEQLTSRRPSPRSLVALANYYEQLHQYSQAADAYTRAIELDPNRLELKGALAQDLALAGRMDDALKAFQDLAAASPNDPAAFLGMAQIYRDQKNFAKAHEMLDKAKEADPNNLDVRLEQARVLEAEGKTAEAIAALKSVVDATNRHDSSGASTQARAELLDSLGGLYLSDSQYDNAVASFRQAATLNPDIASREEARIIESYRAANDLPRALSESDNALKASPKDRTLIEVRAEVLSDQGKYDQAVALLKPLLNGGNDYEIQLALAEVYEKAKDFAAMAPTLDAAAKLATRKEDQVTVRFMRGAMYERQKHYELAEKEFRAALDADPNNASALNYLGYMLADQGLRLTEAQDLIKHAVNLEPNNYAYLDSLGWVEYRLNNLQDAEQELRRSIAMRESDPTIHDHLGDVLFKEGKLKEAIEQWQSSLHAWGTTAPAELEPEEVAKVQRKLDNARVRLAEKQTPGSHSNP